MGYQTLLREHSILGSSPRSTHENHPLRHRKLYSASEEKGLPDGQNGLHSQTEEAGDDLIVIHPRRTGKSLQINTLAAYFNLNHKERFEEHFGGTKISENQRSEEIDLKKLLLVLYGWELVRREEI